MADELKVLVVAAEAVPFAQVGGLAEFAHALPKALRRLNVDARLIVPRYGDRARSGGPRPKRLGGSLPVPVGSQVELAHLLIADTDDVPVYLIYDDQYFGNRERVYGFNDDAQRFTFFCRAVISALQALDWMPDVIHANDWHTAAIPAWLDVYGRQNASFRDVASLYTIHNFAYQGISGRLLLTFGQMTNLPHLSVEPVGKVNWMAQGIAHADLLSTVSPTYARELLTSAVSGDLQPLLVERQHQLYGVLSGIDTETWNPAVDDAIPQRYDAMSLNMRSVNKSSLQRELRLPTEIDIPLMGLVTRLDPLKGLRILAEAFEKLIAARDVQFVLLGTGVEELEAGLQALQERYPRNFRALIRFDERLARRIYGAVDFFVMPSRYEPVSVALMTAMRYGAIPVVRSVSGLIDTVVDVDAQPHRGTGFTFQEYQASALTDVLHRSLKAYDDEARWMELQRRVMSRDFSWDVSARTYVDLYRRARTVHRASRAS